MAQLDRAPDYESGCRRFESSWARQKKREQGLIVPFFICEGFYLMIFPLVSLVREQYDEGEKEDVQEGKTKRTALS